MRVRSVLPPPGSGVRRSRVRRRSGLRRSTALVSAVLLVTVGPAGPASPAPPAAATVPGPVAWSGCEDGFECASVPVPLDHARPAQATISIALIRYPASDRTRRIGSLFVNPGGPGASGVQLVRGAGAAFDEIAGGRFDIVGFDPRGVGASTSVRCFAGAQEQALFYANESVFPVGRAAQRRYQVKLGAFTGACGTRNAGLLPYLSTAAAARDLDLLRAAVGDRQLTYFGLSYGTALGATYANLFPGRVRALVLDGVTDPVAYTGSLFDWVAGSLRDTEQVLAGFAAGCAAAGPLRCALAGRGDVRRRIAALLARLRYAPVPAPDRPVPGLLDYPTTQAMIFSALYSAGTWPQLAAGLAAAEEGDGSLLLNSLGGPIPGQRPVADGAGYDNVADAQAGILCTDSPAPRDPSRWPAFVRRLERISPTGGATFGWSTALACGSWPAQAVERYAGPWNARTAHPVLLIGVTHDPVTPLASAWKLARLMGRSAVLLTHDGYGHTEFGQFSICTLTAVTRYLVRGGLPAPGTVCTADEPLFPAPEPASTGTTAPTRRIPYPVPRPAWPLGTASR
ncbi:MAG TPA: alpha/beta fold hydrolase [Mycobacteriales bacterium]|nr:alpha/beta fold hydrolase [Mycobacteriales bacterium]